MRLRLDLEISVAERPLLSAQLDSTASLWGLSGPSGSGKSTFLKALAGLIPGASGLIEIDGEVWQGPHGSVPAWRRRIGWAPQDALLFPHLSVGQNLLFGHVSGQGPGVEEVAESLHIASLLQRQPRHLSGGEKQRVALGRALLSSPRLLLLDEPFSALDHPLRADAVRALHDICHRWTIPAIVVSHEAGDISPLADTWLEVCNGRLNVKEPEEGSMPPATERGGQRQEG